MLVPIAVMGLVLGCALRFFMTRPVPWAVREGFVTRWCSRFCRAWSCRGEFLGSTILIPWCSPFA